MKHFPADSIPPRAPAPIAGMEHHRAPTLAMRSRAFWFAVGFFAALTLSGYVAGIFHWPN